MTATVLEQKQETKKQPEPKRFIFKSFNNFALGVRGMKTDYIRDDAGKVIGEKGYRAITVIFHNGTVELNPVLQSHFDIPIEDVATLMVNDPNHGSAYRLIWAPKDFMKKVYGFEEPNEEMIDFAQRADEIAQGRMPKVNRASRGARAQADLQR